MEAGICFREHGAGEEEEWELEGLNAQSSCLQVAVMFTEMPESPEGLFNSNNPIIDKEREGERERERERERLRFIIGHTKGTGKIGPSNGASPGG